MPTKWEYLCVNWESSTEIRSEERIFTNTWYVRRRGDSAPGERKSANTVELFNELGDEGWELVESSATSSTVLAHRQGYDEVSFPLAISYLFKRRADEGIQR